LLNSTDIIQEFEELKQLKTYRYKLKPSRQQSLVLGQWLGTCRYVYNLWLEDRRTLWQGYLQSLSINDAQKELAIIAHEVSWLTCVNSQTRQEVMSAYGGLMMAFSRGVKAILNLPNGAATAHLLSSRA
jgi:hypothetical protein